MGHGAVFDLVHNSPDVAAVTVADFHHKNAMKSRQRLEQIKLQRNKLMLQIIRKFSN